MSLEFQRRKFSKKAIDQQRMKRLHRSFHKAKGLIEQSVIISNDFVRSVLFQQQQRVSVYIVKIDTISDQDKRNYQGAWMDGFVLEDVFNGDILAEVKVRNLVGEVPLQYIQPWREAEPNAELFVGAKVHVRNSVNNDIWWEAIVLNTLGGDKITIQWKYPVCEELIKMVPLETIRLATK